MNVQNINLGETEQVVFNGNDIGRLKLNNSTIWVISNYTIQCERADNTTIPLQFVVQNTDGEVCEIKILNDENFTPIIISDTASQIIDLSSTSVTNPIIMFTNFSSVRPAYNIDTSAGTYEYSIKNLKVIDFQPEFNFFTSQFVAQNIVEDMSIPSRIENISLSNIFEAYQHSSYDNTDYVVASDMSDINLLLDVQKVNVPFQRIPINKLPKNISIYQADNSNIDVIGVLDNVLVWVENFNYSAYNVSIPNGVTKIPNSSFSLSKFNSIVVPSTVNYIGSNAFLECTTNITFNQPASMQVSLPLLGGMLGGMLYSKNARSGTIRTDNIIIANYNYEADNFNATILHLDGTSWKLETPVVTASNNIVSWSAITGAVKYSIGYSTTTSNYTYTDTTNTSFDLSQLPLTSGTTYNIVVVAVPVENSSVNIKSNKSIAIQYTA